jgi:hypothetical protein
MQFRYSQMSPHTRQRARATILASRSASPSAFVRTGKIPAKACLVIRSSSKLMRVESKILAKFFLGLNVFIPVL